MISLSVCAVTRDFSIAVLEDTVLLAEMNLRREKIDDLVLLIEQVLGQASKYIEDVDEFVIVNGPGAYAGIRNSLTVIKTLALVGNKPVKTINFLELLAYQNKEYQGLIVVAMESRKGELNYGFYGGGEELNSIIVSDTIKKDVLFEKLRDIKEEFLVVGDLYEVPDLNNGLYKAVTPSAATSNKLSESKKQLTLNEVAPIYSYPVNVNTSSKKPGLKK